MSNEQKRISIGYLSIPMKSQNMVRNQLIKFADIEEIRFLELNKSAPSLDRFDAIIVGWDINNAALFDHLKKIRSVWDNRKIMLIGFASTHEWEKNIALDLGINEWINPLKLASEISGLEKVIYDYMEQLEVALGAEIKAAAAINAKKIDEFKQATHSLLFIDPRNRIFIEFLGEMLSESNLHSEAFELYNRVLMNQPNAVRLLVRAAESLVKLGRHQEAQDFFKKADEAARDYLEASLYNINRKVKGGPDVLNYALVKVNSPERVVDYIESRVSSINEVLGEFEATSYLNEVKKASKISAVKRLNYKNIIKKYKPSDSCKTLTFEKERSLGANVSKKLDYSEMEKNEKIRKRKLKKSS
jgi:tetratricopeptide (TPR) repeat protein